MKMNKLRFWRIEKGLSQWELAAASGVGRWAIQLIETQVRAPSKKEAEMLASSLGITSEQLLSIAESSNE